MPPATTPGGPGAGGSGVPAPATRPPLAGRAKLALRRVSLRSALRRGFVVTVKGAKPDATLFLSAASGNKKVAGGQAKARADGTASVRLKFTASARRKLRRAKRAKLTIRGTGVTPLRIVLRTVDEAICVGHRPEPSGPAARAMASGACHDDRRVPAASASRGPVIQCAITHT